MIKKLLVILGVIVVLASGFTAVNAYRRVVNNSFGPGEHLEYRVHYGFLNAAEAIIDVAPALYKVNDRACYKVDVNGRTVGAFSVVTKVHDTWRSYIDTTAILPLKFYASLHENSFRKEANVTFDHVNNTAKAEELTDHEVFKVPDNVHDVVSSYYFLRTIDFNKLAVGQVVEVPAFYDDTVYNMKVRYRGKETLKTKFGKINVIKLNPVLPSTKGFFKNDESIKIWVSDDTNKIPIKVEVELGIGSLDMDLRNQVGLKQPLKFF